MLNSEIVRCKQVAAIRLTCYRPERPDSAVPRRALDSNTHQGWTAGAGHGALKVGLTIREGTEGARLCNGREMIDARSATKAARAVP